MLNSEDNTVCIMTMVSTHLRSRSYGDIYMHYWSCSFLAQIMACHLLGTITLLESMLTADLFTSEFLEILFNEIWIKMISKCSKNVACELGAILFGPILHQIMCTLYIEKKYLLLYKWYHMPQACFIIHFSQKNKEILTAIKSKDWSSFTVTKRQYFTPRSKSSRDFPFTSKQIDTHSKRASRLIGYCETCVSVIRGHKNILFISPEVLYIGAQCIFICTKEKMGINQLWVSAGNVDGRGHYSAPVLHWPLRNWVIFFQM